MLYYVKMSYLERPAKISMTIAFQKSSVNHIFHCFHLCKWPPPTPQRRVSMVSGIQALRRLPPYCIKTTEAQPIIYLIFNKKRKCGQESNRFFLLQFNINNTVKMYWKILQLHYLTSTLLLLSLVSRISDSNYQSDLKTEYI